ncbi:MAG: prepilin-type N-terminal cleavage/methylation domain-containing protein [Candidatus Gracilibacteria bacterium]|nr:prepilin-type N-terminal cleavage/methylation domain-containing protein [Candidatus Gracilibacteria bacterium]
MNLNKKAFTLVELVVTITIIAILGTIAFVNYLYIVSDSRNAKVETQMSDIYKSIELGKTEGIDIYSFVLENSENTLINPYIAGTETGNSLYKAGKINYLVTGYKKSNEDDVEYRIGVTKKLNTKYQIAGFIEDSSLGKLAVIKGNYNSRTKLGTLSEIKSIVNNKNIILEKNNGLKVLDTIITSGGAISIIKKINSIDNNNDNIYFKNSIDNSTTYISLANDESTGLIMGKNIESNTGVVEELGKILPY